MSDSEKPAGELPLAAEAAAQEEVSPARRKSKAGMRKVRVKRGVLVIGSEQVGPDGIASVPEDATADLIARGIVEAA